MSLDSVLLRRNEIQKSLLDWAGSNSRQYAWRRPRASPYEILIAEILLKRTTATAASRVYQKFLEKYPDIESLSKAKRKEIEKMLMPIGYYRLRSKQLLEIANFVQKELGGKIPDEEPELLQIPYVGPYTAGAILCMGFGKRAVMADSNVERIINRIFSNSLKKKANYKTIFEITDKLVPEEYFVKFNLGLLDLGALLCLPKNPRCNICPIKTVCDYAIAKS